MQNPFRTRDQDERHERDDPRWEARDRRYDEGRSWAGGDGGRVADRFRGQSQGYDGPDWRDREHASDRSLSGARGWGYGQDQRSQYGEGLSTGYTGGRDSWGQSGYGGPTYGGYARDEYDRSGPSYGQADRSRSYAGDYGRSASSYARPDPYSQGRSAWPEHAYAPGSQIWEGQGQDYDHHSRASDFEPDYLHWRNQQLSNFDRDYGEWRNERRQKFSADFDTWRQNRPRTEASGEPRNPTANPVVGDIADGGTGDVKKR